MPLNFAHRGASLLAPENTLPAFQKAIDHGAKAIELDVQLTKDQALVVSHDHRLKRVSHTATGRIKDYTLSELQEIDVGSVFSPNYAGTAIPTLHDVLAICPEDVLLNIEIKNSPVIYEGIEQILLKTLYEAGRTESIIISSFDHTALERIRAMDSRIDLGMLFYYRLLRIWDYAAATDLDIRTIHPMHIFVDETFVKACHLRGFEVYPFAVDDESRYQELTAMGVDGVFSANQAIFGS